NAFDWNAEFPEIFAPSPHDGRGQGEGRGFDAVIGNPPYIRIQAMKEWAPIEVEFYKQRYIAASKGNYDIYVVFAERVLQLLNERGRMGFIMPHKFFQAKYGQSLRKLISSGNHLSEVVHFGDQQVFAGASTYTCLLFLDKTGNKHFHYIKAHDLNVWRTNGEAVEGEISADRVTEKEWNFVVGPGAELFEWLSKMPVKLGDVAARVFQGIIPGMDAVYSLALIEEDDKISKCYSRALDREVLIERSILRKIASGVQVRAYSIKDDGSRVIYPYQFVEDTCTLIPPDRMKRDFPLAYSYFWQTKDLLNKRDRGSAKGPQWYRYIRTQNIGLQAFAKLAIPRLVHRVHVAYDVNAEYCLDNVDVGGVLLPDEGPVGYLYLLGLLNSKLLDFCFRNNSVTFRGGFFSANRQYIEQLPIRTIDFSDLLDKARHDRMVELVETILKLHKQLAAAKTNHEKAAIQRQIDAADKQIDRLVYELYGLTDEEIRIVEEGTK
ncbi:Eco57I restriction-modification methylase domain-containing protein, partial [Candidatus Bipolaricaulota bacterium]|nr:Eco57I restriction-modification methylase domain-containing protein [Candidatus Bipolaricaulota bacterium]